MEMIEVELPVCPPERQTCVKDLTHDVQELICPEGYLVPALEVVNDAMRDEFS